MCPPAPCAHTNTVDRSPFGDGSNTALPQQIYINSATFGGFEAAQDRAWGAALALIAIVFAFTLVARIFTALYTRRAEAT